jgi:hypothetical protein
MLLPIHKSPKDLCQISEIHFARLATQPSQLCGQPQHPRRTDPRFPQLSNTGVPVGLAQLSAVRMPDKRVMHERWRLRPAEHSGQSDLASRGWQQVFSPDDQIDSLLHVIDCHDELIGPVTQPVTQEEVAALTRRLLPLLSQEQVGEAFFTLVEHEPEPAPGGRFQTPVSAAVGVASLTRAIYFDRERLPGAITAI